MWSSAGAQKNHHHQALIYGVIADKTPLRVRLAGICAYQQTTVTATALSARASPGQDIGFVFDGVASKFHESHYAHNYMYLPLFLTMKGYESCRVAFCPTVYNIKSMDSLMWLAEKCCSSYATANQDICRVPFLAGGD